MQVLEHHCAAHQTFASRDRALQDLAGVRLVRMRGAHEVHGNVRVDEITSGSAGIADVAALDLLEHLLDVRYRELVPCGCPYDAQLAAGVYRRLGSP
jgi:hypothetical protein